MARRWTERQLIWRVMMEAVPNIETLIDAMGDDPDGEDVIKEHRALLRAMDRFCVKYYGKTVHDHMNAPFKDAKTVSITELLNEMKQGGDGDIIEGDES